MRRPSEAGKAIYPAASGLRTVWRVLLASRTPIATYEVLVDARNGRVLRSRDLLRRAFTRQRPATVFDTNAIVGHDHQSADPSADYTDLSDGGDSDGTVPADSYRAVTLPRLDTANDDLIGQWAHARLPGGEVSEVGSAYNFQRAADGFEAANAYFHVDRAQQYIQGLGFTNVNNRQQDLHVDDNADDNSFYDSGTKDITFGTGGVDDAEDGDIVVHEYGHSIQDNQVPGFGVSLQGGAMGEGFGDYLAAAVSQTFQPDPLYDACVGEWDQLGFLGGSPSQLPCLRRTDRDLTFAQVDAACDFPGDPNEVHCVGEAWSGALWDIRTAIGGRDRRPARAPVALQPHGGGGLPRRLAGAPHRRPDPLRRHPRPVHP